MRALLYLALAACGGASTLDAGTDGDAGADAGTPRPDAGESEIVRAHNAVRARAMPAPMPALAMMSWHEGAAATAQAWVDGCNFMHNPGINGRYGENIYATFGQNPSPTAVVESWASEAPNYNLMNNSCNGTCGHYTQLVWRDSVGVGCASKVCDTNSPFGATANPWVMWVCDYAPPGNVVGRRPY